MISPLMEELEELYESAMLGLFEQVKDQVEKLAEADAKVEPFAHEVIRFCDGDDDQGLMGFLETLMFR